MDLAIVIEKKLIEVTQPLSCRLIQTVDSSVKFLFFFIENVTVAKSQVERLWF